MNVLFEKFPETVRVQGKNYRIVTDFREWIKLHELLQNTEQFTVRVMNMILEWYIDDPPSDIEAAIYALQDFLVAHQIYQEEDETEEEDEEESRSPSKQVFSFSQDAACIYSDFRAFYGIDIETIGYMHWWKFKVLFDGLPSDSETKERIYYRGLDLNKIKDREERKRVQEIQKRIALRSRRRVLSDYQIGEMF